MARLLTTAKGWMPERCFCSDFDALGRPVTGQRAEVLQALLREGLCSVRTPLGVSLHNRRHCLRYRRSRRVRRLGQLPDRMVVGAISELRLLVFHRVLLPIQSLLHVAQVPVVRQVGQRAPESSGGLGAVPGALAGGQVRPDAA